MKINEWIKQARLSAKLTQEQLGEAIGKTKGGISQWEAGTYEPSYTMLLKIAEITKYNKPLPGISELYALETIPFTTIDIKKIKNLNSADLSRLEANIKVAAENLNIDILK